MPNQFSVQPMTPMSGLKSLYEGIGSRIDFERDKAGVAKEQKEFDDFLVILNSGDFDAISKAAQARPDLAKKAQGGEEARQEIMRQRRLEMGVNGLMGNMTKTEAAIDYTEKAQAEGQDTTQGLAVTRTAMTDDAQSTKDFEMAVALNSRNGEWDQYQQTKGGGGDKPTGNMQDFNYYKEMVKTDPVNAAKFAVQAGITPKKQEKAGAKSKLLTLLDERNALPLDSAEREHYNNAIRKETTKSSIGLDPEQVESMAKMVIEGRLDPNKISKRGGLQQAVYFRAEEMDPGANMVELEANARFKNLNANLTSRALIDGVAPLFERLLDAGKALENTSFQLYNKAVNFAKEQTGDPEIVGFNNLRDDVIAEAERILMGSGVLSDSKYNRALHNANSAQSYEQLEAAVKNMDLAIKTRLHALDKTPFKGASSRINRPNKTTLPEAGHAQPKYTEGQQAKLRDGSIVVFRNGNWGPS